MSGLRGEICNPFFYVTSHDVFLSFHHHLYKFPTLSGVYTVSQVGSNSHVILMIISMPQNTDWLGGLTRDPPYEQRDTLISLSGPLSFILSSKHMAVHMFVGCSRPASSLVLFILLLVGTPIFSSGGLAGCRPVSYVHGIDCGFICISALNIQRPGRI